MKKNLPERFYRLFDWILPLKRGIPFTGCPINRGESFQPFFIVGSGRSGNTLLRRILYAHPDVHIPPETFVLGDTVRLFRQYRNMNWPNLVYFVLAQFEFYPEFETFEVSLRPLAQQLLHAPESSRSLAFILDSLYRYHAEKRGKGTTCKRWGDKTPLNTLVLERIFSVFPDAQFIHMVRDGVDVVASYLEANLYSNIESAAQRWTDSVRAANEFARHHPDNCLELRYETLARDTATTASKVCGFLNIEYNSGMIESHEFVERMGDVAMRQHHSTVGQPIVSNRIGRGRQRFSDEEREQLQEIMGLELARLGYEPATT